MATTKERPSWTNGSPRAVFIHQLSFSSAFSLCPLNPTLLLYSVFLFHPACQVDGGMEQRAEDSSHSQSSHPVIPSINVADGLSSPETSEKDREDPDRELEKRDCFCESQLTDKQGSDGEGGEGGEAEGGEGHTISSIGNELHPSTAGEMDQSKPAEQQGGDLGLAKEKEAKRDVEEAAEALEMEDEGEDEEEAKQKHRESPLCQKALPVETLVSGAEVEVQQLHQEALAVEKLHEDTQVYIKMCSLL